MVDDRWKKIKLIAFDFDGVFTDNSVYTDENGVESVKCCRSDWLTAKYIKDKIYLCVITTETNNAVISRCKKLNLECYCGCKDKLSKLKSIAARERVKRTEIAFVGNDINDLECLKWVGLPIVVNDYSEMKLPEKTILTLNRGGYGAVREVVDKIIREQGICVD